VRCSVDQSDRAYLLGPTGISMPTRIQTSRDELHGVQLPWHMATVSVVAAVAVHHTTRCSNTDHCVNGYGRRAHPQRLWLQ
jgi:hypothetical protein